MKNLLKLKLLVFIFISILFFIIKTSFSYDITKLNFDKDIYSQIPSKDYLFIDYKITPNKKIVIFYKDKEEKNLNKNFVAIMNIKTKKIEKVLNIDYNRYKESIVDKNGNLYVMSWSPVNIYFIDLKNYRVFKIYDNTLQQNQEKYIFTLDSKFIKSSNDEIFATLDLKKEKVLTEDVVICKLDYQNGELNITPYFSSYKTSSFFKDKPYIMLLNYPKNIFINLIKEKELYKIETPSEYSKEVDLSKFAVKFNLYTREILAVKGKYILGIFEKNNQIGLLNYQNPQEIININLPKFISASFLSEDKLIINSLENKKIVFYTFHISTKELKKLGEINGVKIGVLNPSSFFTFNKKEIFVVDIK